MGSNVTRTLDSKLERIVGGVSTPADFIIADAKDGDMGFGAHAPGPERNADGTRTGRLKSREDYLNQIKDIVAQGVVDVMLVSASNYERLNQDGVFSGSAVTPAIRGNDTTDIWTMRGGKHRTVASRPFRSADLKRVRDLGCDLCLYSMTFVNDAEADLRSVEAYREFRQDAANVGMKHFLEVFNPNIDAGLSAEEIGPFVNDCIARSLAGLVSAERPLFLKIVFNGASALSELCNYDPSLVVGVLGGSAGTTRDTFELLSQASNHGAKVALFGRKINLAESPLDIVRLMRAVASEGKAPEEAVTEYHQALTEKGIQPDRPLDTDQQITESVLLSS